MNDTAIQSRPALYVTPDAALDAAAKLWFAVAVAGQWMFAYYIAAFYGRTAFAGDYDSWDARMFNGFISGDLVGNLNIVAHILLAFVITAGGPLQLTPQIRNRFRSFHRGLGKAYVATAYVISIGALYLTWTRTGIGGLHNAIGVSITAVLIIIFATLAIRAAMARDFKSHHRWALRLFIAVSGVWFFRVGFGLYAFLTGGEMPGSQSDLEGPFDIGLSYAQTLFPLACLELFLRARSHGGAAAKSAMAAGMLVLTAATGIGAFMAAQIFWLPNL